MCLVAASCGEDATPQTLLLEISSEAPASGGDLEALRLLFHQGEGADRVMYPAAPDGFEFEVSEDFDPVAAAVVIEVAYAESTFDGPAVMVTAAGHAGGRVVTLYSGEVDLLAKEVHGVRLLALADPDACDADADGFPDCTIDDCCPGGAGGLSDCEPADGGANPWAVEDPCEQCGDGIDQDCVGGDAVCVDDDTDGVKDCLETCGLGDPTVAPGLVEFCDGKDNDCDGETDEGFIWQAPDGSQRWPGASCGQGECAGGVVECALSGEGGVVVVRCSTAIEAAPTDLCGDGKDNDCDGSVDEGCAEDDLDGDGWTPETGDCDDHDASINPAAWERCCPTVLEGHPTANDVCDRNCDAEDLAFCALDDKDDDGWSPPNDCDDTNPAIHPGAAERCGDGLDQDCLGGDAPCEGFGDADGDGYARPEDCDDTDPETHPGTAEVCDGLDQDCDGLIDEGNPDDADDPETTPGEACASGSGACADQEGVWVCAASSGPTWDAGEMACVGAGLPAEETCDGLDNDCDGETDEGFPYYDPDSGAPAEVGSLCSGVGGCAAFAGVVECSSSSSSACSTNPGASGPQATDEVCNGVDDDCDGVVDEGIAAGEHACPIDGVCASDDAQFMCVEGGLGQWTCDFSAVAGYEALFELSCDGLDNDCDGDTDEAFGYDGAPVGAVCAGVGECGAVAGVVECLDVETSACSTNPDGTDPQDEPEVCNGRDDDCDGVIDEGVPPDGTSCSVEGVCASADAVFTCVEAPDPPGTGEWICDYGAVAGYEAGTELSCDGLDNDCDGLTDEDLPSGVSVGDPCDGPDEDLCSGGQLVCAATGEDPGATTCDEQPGAELAEVCDGQDNDCDGATDEDLGGAEASDCTMAGVCGLDGALSASCDGGVWTCVYTGEFYSAGGEVGLCDGLDNDCDGATDEDFGPDGGVAYDDNGVSTYLGWRCGAGACLGGDVVCGAGGASLSCSSLGEASDEVCDGVDNDCDGLTDAEDDSLVIEACEVELGVCGGAQKPAALCADGAWAPCGPDEYLAHDAAWEAEPEVACDELDNDCDGETDDPCGPCGDLGVPCPNGYYCTEHGTCESELTQMVFVPGGSFDRGCKVCDGKPENCNSEPDAPVGTVDQVDDFFIDRTEVTFGAYCACVAAGTCTSPAAFPAGVDACPDGPAEPAFTAVAQRPVFEVDWDQATTYCEASAKRLCTEAEWEKAARGTDARCYTWGDETPSCQLAWIDAGGDGCGTGVEGPVGSKPAGRSPYGTLDQIGNLCEWVSDWYAADAYTLPSDNPTGPATGPQRVTRGGDYKDKDAPKLTTWHRDKKNTDTTDPKVGLRCCQDGD